MLQLHCNTFQQVDAAWLMLTSVPDHLFQPVQVILRGQTLYTIIRTPDGRQTTAALHANPPA